MRVRQHVNPMAASFDVFRGSPPVLDLTRPIEVEIGCAEAQFLFERAVVDPQRQYVGLEIREDLVDLVNKQAATIGAPVHAVFCHAQVHADMLFPEASVDRVYINFPDPWFKRRHHKRRMVDDVLMRSVARMTKPGGDVLMQTDVWELAIESLALFEGLEAYFVNQHEPWRFWRGRHPFGVRSWREMNAEQTGLPIWRMLYRRTDTPLR